ncbi:PilZ domain-containing protein [Novosphingobium sp. 1949]|uniref:PilZ domain-containing protein n=1 Tax=Novosphingobium organovorum TaxID=2930092 RepID=A0ABT0BFP1_9SPHN|nr:PilZ domain-containing protein [Novosphingobium organovorum]MCJ2183803.1 PilZ domain-containing protein [Novosphingobium organovorum]
MNRPIIPRRSVRKPVSMAVQCRTQSGLRDSGEIFDISAEGCCLQLAGLFLKVGARLILRPSGLEAFSGVVRWISGDFAGIEFDRPMYGPVVDHLALQHAARIEYRRA